MTISFKIYFHSFSFLRDLNTKTIVQFPKQQPLNSGTHTHAHTKKRIPPQAAPLLGLVLTRTPTARHAWPGL